MAFSGAIRLTEKDNVATSLETADGGSDVEVRLDNRVEKIKALETIPFGFKIAVADIAKGSHIIKYGESIGIAATGIKRGDLVHVHNLEGARGRGDLVKSA